MADNRVNEVLRLDGVHKSYSKGTATEVEVLHGIDLVLQQGEFTALIGPSGSGKSTLLNIIGLLDRPTAGSLFVAGKNIGLLDDAELTRLRGRTIGFVFQYHYLLTAFTALENVMMPMLLEHGRPNAQMRRIAASLLDKVGLAQWQDHLVTNMSGGQQQRVAIARALALDPPLILADEPTGNLDTQSANNVFELMRHISATSGTTFLLVTHNLELARRCDRVLELVDGNIIADRAKSVAQLP